MFCETNRQSEMHKQKRLGKIQPTLKQLGRCRIRRDDLELVVFRYDDETILQMLSIRKGKRFLSKVLRIVQEASFFAVVIYMRTGRFTLESNTCII